MVIRRNDKDRLVFNALDIQIMFDEMFYSCKTEKEAEWLREQLVSHVDAAAQEVIDNL